MENSQDNCVLIRQRRNDLMSPIYIWPAAIHEEAEMDDDYLTPDSARTYNESMVDFIIEEALEQSQDPAVYLTSLMPSRHLYRSGHGSSPTYQTCQMARKRTSSTCRRSMLSETYVDAVDCGEPVTHLKTSSLMDSVNLLKGVSALGREKTDDDVEDRTRFKCLPEPMAVRREKRDMLTKSRERIDNRYRRANWRCKMSKNYNFVRESVGSAFSNIHFWATSIHNIEGHYGTAVAAVFFFIQWLMTINLMMMILVVSFIVIPNAVIVSRTSFNQSQSDNHPVASLVCNYTETATKAESEFGEFQDLLQGTGWMEWTSMFYGYYFYNYTNSSQRNGDDSVTYDNTRDLIYNLPLAYIAVTLVYFIICLFFILKSAAKDSREILFTATAKINECCNLVFCGWDFCIVEENKATIRKEIICNEITNILNEEKLWEERLRRTNRQNIQIIFNRVLINIIVFVILAFCGGLIYGVIVGSQHALTKYYSGSNSLIVLTIEFLPPFTIVLLNLVVPLIFEKLVLYEHYSPVSVNNMTLGRTVVLKLAGILVLLGSFYKTIVKNDTCTYHCWETYVGQQIYKLTIMDFAFSIVITFLIQFPRKLIVKRYKWHFIQWIGQQPFDVPSQVLDIIYSQTLCWMGTFFSPLLSVVNVIKFFLLFYMKRFSLFINCAPARLTYRASKSNKLFMMMLLLSYIIASLPVYFSVVEIVPSSDCGPFIGYDAMWDIVPETMENWPNAFQRFLHYFTTAGFVIPAVICLSLIIYFYTTVASAHRRERELLQDQLLVEGQDKQYLLSSLHKVMAQLSNDSSATATTDSLQIYRMK